MSLENFVTSNGFFSWSEFTVSSDFPNLADNLKLSHNLRKNVIYWVRCIGDPFRLANPSVPLKILSGYRDLALNKAIGGSDNSDHLHAMAVDIYSEKMDHEKIFCKIIDMGISYRQLILYKQKRFVHISVNTPEKTVKKETLIV